MMIINSKTLIKMAIKWQRLAAIRRKKISETGTFNSKSDDNISTSSSSSSPSSVVARKGHFVVYTYDKRRFVLPISYLSNYIFIELFKMSEEEFGLPKDGPITLPCDATFMEYAVSLIKLGATYEVNKAFLMSVAPLKTYNYVCSSTSISAYSNICPLQITHQLLPCMC